ncbi:MAG: hypothetical protein C0501_10175 [Isosphaera sp.]|nr:hypothetical protein [Isosphaera sp.]
MGADEVSPVRDDDRLPMMQAVGGVPGSKDGKGIGELAGPDTVAGWVRDYLAGTDDADGRRAAGFRFGVGAEGRHAGRSFPEAEAEVRAEWASEKGRPPWEAVRDAVWAGFDRARDRRV